VNYEKNKKWSSFMKHRVYAIRSSESKLRLFHREPETPISILISITVLLVDIFVFLHSAMLEY